MQLTSGACNEREKESERERIVNEIQSWITVQANRQDLQLLR